jgi:uncharacterized iron-regulated membrane protein
MKKVFIILGVIALIVGVILLFIWLGQEIARSRFENWRQYLDYLNKARL